MCSDSSFPPAARMCRSIASCSASGSSPEAPCLSLETRRYKKARCAGLAQVRTEQSYLLLYGWVLNEAEEVSNRRPTAQVPAGPVQRPPCTECPRREYR